MEIIYGKSVVLEALKANHPASKLYVEAKSKDPQLDEIIKNLVVLCRSRKVKINSINNVEMGMFHNISTTQKEGGASMFIVDLEQFIKV